MTMPPLVVQLSKLRRELNGRLKDFIGDDPEDKSKALQYVFNDKNNIFVDIEAVERSMIKLYGITLDGKYSCHNLHE
jgi:hypothetical protein